MSIKQNFPSIRPSLLLDFANTKQLDPRVTFTRASTATYWDGVTQAKAEENLLKYSQDFDNAAWEKVSVTVAANTATAPDGTATADLLVTANGSSGLWYLQQLSAVASPAMFSIYAKANTANHIGVALGNSGVFAGVDLSTGTVTLQGSGYVVTTTSIGGGWYRVTVAVAGGSDRARIFASTTSVTVANQSVTGDGTSGIYIWGAQLEQRGQATAYTPTTAQPITKYQPVLLTAPSGVPRFDHNPATGESLGLLIEEQRTNTQPYSSDFSNAVWTKTNATVTAAAIVAPDGTLTGSQLVESTGTVTPQLLGSVATAANINHNISVYVKAVVGSAQRYVYIGAKLPENTRWGYYLFNPNTGLVVNSFADGIQDFVSTPIVNPVGNGWFRLSMVFNSPLAGQVLAIGLTNVTTPTNNATLGSYSGDGYSGIYIWGAQLEAGSFPTSYIPTTTAQVTRAADSASMTGANFSSWYRQDEGTLHADVSSYQGSVFQRVLTMHDGSSNNQIWLTSTAAESFAGYAGGAFQWQIALSSAVGRIAGAYKTNDIAVSKNGSSVSTDTSARLPILDRARIGASWNGDSPVNGCIRRIAYYPKRLPDATLQALTA